MRKTSNVARLWALYESSVQDPPRTVKIVDEIYRQIFRKAPKRLREDFCGTFAVGREWIKRGSDRRASGVDISKPVVREAVQRNSELLEPDERRRTSIHCSDVRAVSRTKSDVIIAENFSFFVFKKRDELKQYLRGCYRSLDNNGLVILDMIGGSEFTETPRVDRETRWISPPQPGLPRKFIYTWNQLRFNPATAFGLFSIGFEVEGKKTPNAFTYDWRVWTVPEVRDCLDEAGFNDVKIFWDDESVKLRLREVTSIPNTRESWLCLLVGVKK